MRRPSAYRGVLATTLALAAWLAGVGLMPGAAWAGWSRTLTVDESQTCGPSTARYEAPEAAAFDQDGGVWVTCEPHHGAGLVIGRLTTGYRLADVHVVPGTEGLAIRHQAIAINRSGVGVLAWSYSPSADEYAKGGVGEGVAAITWHVGTRPGNPVGLLSEQIGLWRTPHVAINNHGQAVVLFASRRWETPRRRRAPRPGRPSGAYQPRPAGRNRTSPQPNDDIQSASRIPARRHPGTPRTVGDVRRRVQRLLASRR